MCCGLAQAVEKLFLQVGAMVSYILDAIRYREGALGAIWVTLGAVNLSLCFSEASFLSNRPVTMSVMTAICSGILLFVVGETHPLPR